MIECISDYNFKVAYFLRTACTCTFMVTILGSQDYLLGGSNYGFHFCSFLQGKSTGSYWWLWSTGGSWLVSKNTHKHTYICMYNTHTNYSSQNTCTCTCKCALQPYMYMYHSTHKLYMYILLSVAMATWACVLKYGPISHNNALVICYLQTHVPHELWMILYWNPTPVATWSLLMCLLNPCHES